MLFEEDTEVLSYFPDSVWGQILVLVFSNELIGERVKVGLDFHEV